MLLSYKREFYVLIIIGNCPQSHRRFSQNILQIVPVFVILDLVIKMTDEQYPNNTIPVMREKIYTSHFLTLYNDPSMYLQHGTYPKPDIEGVNKSRLHTHPKCELLCIFKGKGTVHIEGNRYDLRPGTFFLMRPGEAHYIALDPTVPYDRSTLYFDPAIFDSIDGFRSLLQAYFEREPGKYNRYHLSDYSDTECIRWYKNMLDQPDKINIVINLMCILRKLNTFYNHATKQTAQESLEYQILRYIQEHPQEDLTPQLLCSKFYISRTQLYRRFKETTGTSVSEYISMRRVLRAQELIAQGYKPTECYTLAGFSDYSTFYRAYIKHLGYSPNQESGKIIDN